MLVLTAQQGGENMLEDVQKLREVLFEFVKRAAGEKATPEEVEALPRVAEVLLATFALGCLKC